MSSSVRGIPVETAQQSVGGLVSGSAASGSSTNRLRRRFSVRPLLTIRMLLIVAGCLIFLAPVLIMLSTALQPEASIVQRGPAAFPQQLGFGNFTSAWSQGDLGSYYLNSILILIVRVPCAVLISSLAAYPIAKMRFRARKSLLVALVVGLGVPQVILLYPLLSISRHLGVSGSLWVLIGPYIATGVPFEILVMRGAFAGIAREYLEERVSMVLRSVTSGVGFVSRW